MDESAASARPGTDPARGALPMCYACGQMLQATEARCPSCGAPIRTLRHEKRPGTMTVAGVLFVGLFLLIAVNGVLVVTGAEEAVEANQSPTIFGGAHAVGGSVTWENGSTAAGVNVSLENDPGRHASSDTNGTYRLEGVATGPHVLLFRPDNQTVLRLRILVLGTDLQADARLPPAGATAHQDHPSFEEMARWLRIAAVAIVALSLVILGAAYACFRRRLFKVAVAGSALVMLYGLLFLPVLLLGVLALVLVVRNRKNFG